MKIHTTSTLGYIMESLNVQTVRMSRELHVDPSLISKWKTGNRNLSSKSVYYEDVIHYLMQESVRSGHHMLRDALAALYPHEEPENDEELEKLLRLALKGNHTAATGLPEANGWEQSGHIVTTSLFEDSVGRREAVWRLLDYAEAMVVPGEILFLDSAEYDWLLEEETYARDFCRRMEQLLARGFHAKFVIHYSSYKERFIRVFRACSPLIFHRSVEWYYYEYYDENFFNFSFFILNRAVSLLGIASGNMSSTTMIFTDNNLVLRHEALAADVIRQCKELFTRFEPSQFAEVVEDISHSRRKGTFYSYLPAPAFMSVSEELLMEVLEENHISEENIKECRELNHRLREVTRGYFASQASGGKEAFVHIFQLEELLHRISEGSFYSGSLTLLGGAEVRISSEQYARELRQLAEGLHKHDNLQIILVSEKDEVALPAINCWCKQNTWMVQMDELGFRLSEEVSVVNAASITLEQCIHKVPPERKERESVYQYLTELAEELAGGEQNERRNDGAIL